MRSDTSVYPALKLTILYIVSILILDAVSPEIHWPINKAIVSSLVVLTGIVLYWRFQNHFWGLFVQIIAVFFLVLGRMPDNQFQTHHVSSYLDLNQKVLVHGTVVNDPQINTQRTRFAMETDSVVFTRNLILPSSGKIQVVCFTDSTVRPAYGDRISIWGYLRSPRGSRNPGEFDFAAYAAYHGLYGVMYAGDAANIRIEGHTSLNPVTEFFILPIKHFIIELNEKTLPPLHAAIASGLIVGDRSDIPQEILNAFSYSGAIHILSISGLHVVFISLLILGLFSVLRVPYAWRIILTLISLFLYVWIADFVPPAVRAGIMTGVVLFGTLLERRTNIINSLCVSLLIILFWDPLAIFDIGLQLSFLAVLSLVIIYPRLEAWCKKRRILTERTPAVLRWVIMGLLVSVAAQIGTLPFTAYYFYKIPLTALIANVFISPISSAVMALGFLSAIVGSFSFTLAQWYAHLNDYLIGLMIATARFSVKLPFAYTQFYRMDMIVLSVYYLSLAVWFFWDRKLVRRWAVWVVIAALSVGVIFQNIPTSKKTVITFLDVGQGDACVIHLDDGRTIVIDAGDQDSQFDYGERVVAPYLWKQGITSIDALILSHPHDDHIGGAGFLLNHFDVKRVFDPGQYYPSAIYKNILNTIAEKSIDYQVLQKDRVVTFGPETRIRILHPGVSFVRSDEPPPYDINNTSLVFVLEYGENRILFSGDAETETWDALSDSGMVIKADIVKIAHHGSSNGTTAKLIEAASPAYAVISCGEGNKFGHPDLETVNAWRNAGTQVLRTDQWGAVQFWLDGKSIQRTR